MTWSEALTILVPTILATLAVFLAVLVVKHTASMTAANPASSPSGGSSSGWWNSTMKTVIWIVGTALVVAFLLWILFFTPVQIGPFWDRQPTTILGWLLPGLAVVLLVWVAAKLLDSEKIRKISLVAGTAMVVLAGLLLWRGHPLSDRPLFAVAETPKPPLATRPLSMWPKMPLEGYKPSNPVAVLENHAFFTCGRHSMIVQRMTNGIICDFKTCPPKASIESAWIQNLSPTYNEVPYGFCPEKDLEKCRQQCLGTAS